MKNFKINISTLLIVVLLFSCNDILDENPDNRTTIDSAEKIGELLVGAYPTAAYVTFLEPMSDNADDKGPSADESERVNNEMYFWNDLNDIDADTPTNYWNQAYEAIAQANQALKSIDELGNGADLSHLKGEALLCRAYGHYMLVNIFSKAYNPTTADSDLGIPYITEPENVLLGDYERGTVANVYANIRKDLEEGLPLVADTYDEPGFHFTIRAANAFASRFYLTVGEWQNVINHSNVALGTGDASVLRNWETEYRPTTYSQQSTRYASTVEPANLLVVTAGSLYNRFHFSARYQLSGDLVDIIFPNQNPTGKRWSYGIFGSGGGLFNNLPKFDEYFRFTNQAAGIGLPFVSYVLLSTDEVLANRAEAYAMLGQFNMTLNDINMMLSVKTRGYDPATDTLEASDIEQQFTITDTQLYTPFYTISSEALPYINAVLSLKRTIHYNEGLRWFDIKRHDIEINHEDFFNNVFTLPKGDNRRAVQIPEAAQSFGIQANPR